MSNNHLIAAQKNPQHAIHPKTKSLREIYEQTLVSDEHLQYALFSSHPTIFEEAMKDVQWLQENEEVNNEVASIDE